MPGKHLEAIREKGLHLKSDLKGEHYLPVKACTAEEYNEQTDVIFVCVKGYSINSIQDVLERASHQDTLVIPILNVYGTGPRIGRLVPRVTVLTVAYTLSVSCPAQAKSRKWAKYSALFSEHAPNKK